MVIPVQVKPRGARSGLARDVLRAMAGVDPPMFAVTTSVDGVRAGCLVGFVTQCAVHPVRYLVCLAKANHTTRVAADADLLVIHALGQQHHGLAALFATTTGDCIDKFAHCGWTAGPAGLPILSGCQRWVVGRIADRHDLGDHIGFVLDVIAAGPGDPNEESLRYSAVREFIPGHG
ncbi:MAG TPA: flavin reductase family protein [Pseudonocardiaceae bacterium]|nr:flavin reductase family protein [Pseudonocardiaceae bacterium]